MDEDAKEHVLRFLRRCVTYADESIQRKKERGEKDEVIAQWETYREFTAYAASEVQRGDLNDWFGSTKSASNLDLTGEVHQLNPDLFDHKERSAWLGAIVAPRPLHLVSTISKDGVRNIAPMSSISVVSNSPPLIGMSLSKDRKGRSRDTLQNLIETKRATLSVMPPHMDIVRWIEDSAQPLPSDQSEWMNHAAITSEDWPDAPASSLVALQTTLVAHLPLPEGAVAEWVVLRVDGILSPTLDRDQLEKQSILTMLTDAEVGDTRTSDTWRHRIERPD
tara:strand:+ start:62 stop:895 length:834 start_codon:yes stop_codon:yes gene_type:complete